MDDTGQNIPESRKTLYLQQRQLLQGKRIAQMFPIGTMELPLPDGFERVNTARGIFHFNPELATSEYVVMISDEKAENLILALGPFSKKDVNERFEKGEELLAISELNNGVEVKSAAGTSSTLGKQLCIFEASKLTGSVIIVEPILEALNRRRHV